MYPLSRSGVIRCSVFIVSIYAAAASEACYHYRVSAPRVANLTDPSTTTQWSLFWGLVQSRDEDTSCACLNNGLKEVTATTNFAYLLLGVASLGIAVPTEMTYVCSKPPPGGSWPTPPSSSACANIVRLPVPDGRSGGLTPPAPSASSGGKPLPPPSSSTPHGTIPNDADAGSF